MCAHMGVVKVMLNVESLMCFPSTLETAGSGKMEARNEAHSSITH